MAYGFGVVQGVVLSPLCGMATNENGGRHTKHGRTCPKPTVWDGVGL